VTFVDDKKGKILGTGIIKVNDFFTLNDVTLVDKLFIVTMGLCLGMPHSISFALSMVLISNSLPHMFLNRIES
jgi:hypothetical protein